MIYEISRTSNDFWMIGKIPTLLIAPWRSVKQTLSCGHDLRECWNASEVYGMQGIQRPTPIFLVVVYQNIWKKTVYWGWCVDVCIHLAIPKLQQDPQDLVICQACQTYTLPKTNAALEHLSGPICAYMRIGPPPVHCCFVPHPAEKATGNFILLRIP